MKLTKIKGLIKELKQLSSNAKREGLLKLSKSALDTSRHLGKMQAFELCIKKLTLLLKEETTKDLPDEKDNTQ